MTKIKNTKKGMAKKTLSMSLVVAMLATSNVPVWAAEFSDGSDAAFTSEAEAPVVEEEVTDTPAAQAEDSQYTVDFKDLPSEIQWGKQTTLKIKITDGDKNVTSNMKLRFLENGVQVDDPDYNNVGLIFYKADSDGYVSLPLTLDKKFVGKKLQLQVYEGEPTAMTWSKTSSEFTVAKKEVSGTATFTDGSVRYTGSQITTAPTVVGDLSLTGVENSDTVSLGNWVITGKDTVNAFDVSNEWLTATAEVVSEYYTGTVTGTFRVWRKSVSKADDAATAELPTYTYEYTGSNITVKGKDITVTDKTTGQAVKDAANDLSIDKAVGKKTNVKVSVDMKKGSLKNISKNDADFNATESELTLSKDVEVKARDLSNTSNTSISINTVTEDLLQNSTIDADALRRSNLVIKDTTGITTDDLMKDKSGNLTSFANNISLEFENGAKQLKVEPGKTYKAIIKGDGTNVINSREVTFTVVAHDLNAATFTKENDYKTRKPEYTGKQITFGLTAANLREKLGDLKISGDKLLTPGTDYDVNVEFGENVNAGKGQIIINGKGSYAGSKKVIEFTIEPRTVESKNVVVPEKVIYDPSITDVSDYKIEASIVVKGKDENNNDCTVTVPETDYTVAYVGTNKVGNKITTTLTQKTGTSNFKFTAPVTGTTTIAYKAIKDADVQLNKTEYTYTGNAIIPDYTVTVDGATLVKGTDYKETVTYNTNVGEATLTVTGMGEYDTTSVVKKFNIVAANISDLTVESQKDAIVYDGTQHVGTTTTNNLTIKLGDKVFDASNFIVSYPTDKTSNINAGNGTVTLKPAKNNKNFTGEKEFTFTIDQAALNGTLAVYDKNGTKLTNIDSTAFEYDGTAHEFAKVVFTPTVTGSKKVTADDYEIVYKDNIKGDANEKGHILVLAKGNYKSATTYKTADNEEVKNVVLNTTFKIIKASLDATHTEVTIKNGAYKGGFDVEPTVTVSYKGKTLTEGVDYKLDYSKYTQDRKNVTNGKTLKVDIVGMGGYKGTVSQQTWGIDKFDLANASILVSGTDAEPVVKVMNGSVLVDEKDYDLVVADGKATVTATKDNKNYTGTQTVDIKHELEKPEAPMIDRINVSGNKATVILSDEAEGASGYDYVISTSNDPTDKDARIDVVKNQVQTYANFKYVPQGMYYAYCHAWTRDENGKKVFSDWSNVKSFTVTATTPETPEILSVKRSGSTITVTYKDSAYSEGYDVVLGNGSKKEHGETRPYQYGTYKKLNVKPGICKAVFKNVSAGTYYVGVHSWNRSAEENNNKVFSKWSNLKKVTVK
ncbi:hypothetical protein [Blautia wexlerae]|uniref:hypothetical protein n=1 Tax=Blautia wexlerae TaxID=418240 RepID=UPI0003FF2333|nr:hypothetical protein [Blautia wexlerae]